MSRAEVRPKTPSVEHVSGTPVPASATASIVESGSLQQQEPSIILTTDTDVSEEDFEGFRPREAEPEPEVVAVPVVEEYVDLKPNIKQLVSLSDMKDEVWTAEHDMIMDLFLENVSEKLLAVYKDPHEGLKVELSMPTQNVDQIMYFIRKENAKLRPDNLVDTLQFGSVRGGYTEALLRLMNGIYAPHIFTITTWPESIRNHFSAQMHRFLASLTDTRYKLQSHTVLYIPIEAMNIEPEKAMKDKELVQRLETCMVHWTRQIKEVLSAQEALETGENSGPLEEIEFWADRCKDLSGISQQLDKPGVKHIEAILQLSKSSYIAPFQKLSKQIQDGSQQAQSNLQFLSILKAHYEELAELKPKEIPSKYLHILSLIRIIWVNSPFYNSRERITALLRKMSNEIIRLCCREISLDQIFDGYILSSRQVLRDCISCCLAWKECYLKAVRIHHRLSTIGWVLDQTTIFAQVDAYMQRCKDLLEVCECQQQFGRWEDGQQTPLPCFSGHIGPQITRNLLEIEETFQKNLLILKQAKKTILDIKNTTWHDDYNRFRAGIKDLEVMMQNLISTAFGTVRYVEHGVELLGIFHHLATRETIKRTFDKKAVEVYMRFKDELTLVNKELSKKQPHLASHMPHYAGQAHWVRCLRHRIERPMEGLADAYFLPRIGSGEETVEEYQHLAQLLDEWVRKIFTEWSQGLDKQAMKRLDTPLLMRNQDKPGMLDINFDKGLLKLFAEIHYWERLLFEIPHYVVDVYHRKDELHNLRENVLLVVRDYNRIIAALSIEEKGLFRERIRFLDKKIQPGLTKLHWASKGASNLFLADCRLQCSRVQFTVDEYKMANVTIARCAKQISELLLVHIDSKRVYKDLEFEDHQQDHRMNVQQKLLAVHEEISTIMRQIYDVFRQDGPEVQQHWVNYTEKMDKLVEEAFRLNIKWSLQELSKAINGDSKTTPNPLFRVMVVLQNDFPGSTAQVEFSPTLTNLANAVNGICGQIINTISIFRRLPDTLTRRKSQREPLPIVMERDEDIKKIQAQISSGMAVNATHLQTYLKTWDSYREIWEINKDSFIRRYQRLNPPVSSFDADIARYTEVANNVQKEETVLNIQFVLLDCSNLKFSLVQHCNEWQNKFTTLLSEMASTKLLDLDTYLKQSAESYKLDPTLMKSLIKKSLSPFTCGLWQRMVRFRTNEVIAKGEVSNSGGGCTVVMATKGQCALGCMVPGLCDLRWTPAVTKVSKLSDPGESLTKQTQGHRHRTPEMDCFPPQCTQPTRMP